MVLSMLTDEGRKEFLEARRDGIGSSDIAAICGVDPYRDAIDVYFEKTRPPRDDDMSIHALRGVLLEDVAAQVYQEMTGRKVRRHKQRAHPEMRWAQSNIDRQILADGKEIPSTGALEVKCPSTGVFQRIIDYGLSDHQIMQLQWQLFTTGYEWGEWAVLNLEHNAGPLLTFPMEKNPVLIEQMVEVGAEFWNLVEARSMPDPQEWVGVERIEVPSHDTTRHRLEEDPDGMIAAIMDAYELRKQGQELYEERKEQLSEWMDEQDYTRVELPGQGKVNYGWREGRTHVALKKLRAALPLDRDKVRNWLRDELPLIDHFDPTDEEIEQIFSDLELDWSAFEYHNEPHRHFQVYPSKERG